MLVKKVDVLPIECVVRGYISGSGWASYRKNGTICGIRLPDGRIVAATRLYYPKQRTSLSLLDPDAGTLQELIALPSGGDTSYAGLVWHEGLLWISYYSSHEGKTSIYLAKVKFRTEN